MADGPMREIFKIRRALIIPLGLALCAVFTLMLLAWVFTAIPGERLILAIICMILGYLFLDLFFRQVKFASDGLTIGKLWKQKRFHWDEITHIGSVTMGPKVYVLLTTTNGFYILSNNYERFSQLLRELSKNLSQEKVDADIIGLIEHPLDNKKPVFSAWIMLLLVMAVIALRYFIF